MFPLKKLRSNMQQPVSQQARFQGEFFGRLSASQRFRAGAFHSLSIYLQLFRSHTHTHTQTNAYTPDLACQHLQILGNKWPFSRNRTETKPFGGGGGGHTGMLGCNKLMVHPPSTWRATSIHRPVRWSSRALPLSVRLARFVPISAERIAFKRNLK